MVRHIVKVHRDGLLLKEIDALDTYLSVLCLILLFQLLLLLFMFHLLLIVALLGLRLDS